MQVFSHHLRSPVRGTDRRNRSDRASRATRRIKRHRFNRSLPGLPSCTVACSGTVFRYARPEPSRPGREMRSFPHACIIPAALVGFFGALRRFAPASGRPAHHCPATAHMPVASTSPRPIDFRRADFAALRKGTMRANVRQNRGKSGCWLLGNSFCGPYPPASFSSPANRSCLGLLPLAGLAGTRRAVHSCGLDPARITCPREPPG